MQNIQIKQKQIEYLYTNLTSGISAIFILSLMLFILFDGLVDTQNLTIWTALSISIVVLRGLLFLWYKKHPLTSGNVQAYYLLFFLGLFASSLVLGSSVFFIFPKEIEYQVLLLLVLGGISAGAAVTTSSRIEMFNVYLLMTLMPFVYAFATGQGEVNATLSVFALLYVIILLVISRKISITVNKNITLALENEALVEQLQGKVEEATNLNEAKTRFLSTMSHEIRTPMNAIIGFIKILQKMEDDPTKNKYLSTIDNSSNLLLNVLNDILDINKIESGKLDIELMAFNPKEEFEFLFDLYKTSCHEKGIHLINSIGNLPLSVESDKLRLKQIMTNLLSNALKFTPSGKNIELIVAYNKEACSLHIEVRDEGIGIKQENISKVVEEFSQADGSTARKYGGTGLGLAIVSKLLALLGAKLEIESEYGKGSRFYFYLPVKEVEAKIENTVEQKHIKLEGKKILVAEDNKTNQMLVGILLEERSLSVVMADDGQKAHEKFNEEAFDMVLMDINMPNMNGIEAMQAIKADDDSVPIVALTANAVSGDKEKYLKLGFDDYLSKPIDDDLLELLLQKYL